MGGTSTACSTKQKKHLLSVPYFKPEVIIGKSVKYNLTSDAAHKFERGVDIQAQEKVLRRFIEIVKIMQQLKILKFKHLKILQAQQNSIPINVKKINKILGIDIEEKEYLIIFK